MTDSMVVVNHVWVCHGDCVWSSGYGMMTDGTTTFVNASACTVNFLPMNAPIVFDLPNPRTTWLEEARPKSPTTNQEKGAKKGRWGRRAGNGPVSVNKRTRQVFERVERTDPQTDGRTLLLLPLPAVCYCFTFLHPDIESKRTLTDERRDAFSCRHFCVFFYSTDNLMCLSERHLHRPAHPFPFTTWKHLD